MQKFVDIFYRCEVPFVCLLETGKPGTAPVSIAAFLYPAFKGVLGWMGNIPNTHRSLVCAVSNIPALVLNPFERSQTMKTARKHLISDLAHKAAKDLHLLRNITQQAPAILSQNAQSIKELFDMVELRLACINHQALKGINQ